MDMYNQIRNLAEKYSEYTIHIRRSIHQNPELSMQEYKTAALIRQELDSMGISWRTIGETGVLGTLPATEPGGYTVALRADIDALPVCEATGLPFASKVEGVMHACGHDTHAAMLLGAAKILSSMEKRPNTTVFVFQPAEEFGIGAKLMLDGNALDGVDVIYGSHVWPDLPAGQIGLLSGPLMAGADKFLIRVLGKGGHGSQPERCHDPIPACTAIADGIHQVKSLSLRGDTPLVLTVGYIKCGTAMNIIPDSGELGGTIRWFDRESQQIARERIQKIAEYSCAMYDCRAEVEFTDICHCTENDPACTEHARKALSAMYGEDAVAASFPLALGSEDFSYYGKKAPAVFGFIGCSNERQQSFPLHNPHFSPDEAAFERGSALYAAFACGYQK
ncbi:MAG: amidohydrolase [Clostridia bacterium]|nr:amidohydrolase [Clostridia bacterium]